MKLLVTMKLSDRSLWNHIFPITCLKNVENITLVRDTPGPDMDKIRYVTPSRYRVTSSFLMVPIKLLQLIQSSLVEKPSLIHSYLLFPHGYLAFIAGKLTGRKVGVSLIAGPVETYILGGSPIGQYAYCYPLPQSNLLNRAILSVLKRFDVITTTGTYTKNYLISKGINENKIFILPHVVDERFQPLDIEKDYDVVFVGRLAPVKHVETLIRATAQIKESLPSIRVVIVGDGEERSKLEELARSLDLTDQIDFVGYQTNTWEWYNRSKLSVVTSEREGFPYTVIESLKCGVPVVTSNCGDVCDLVEDSVNGIIVPDYRDYSGFAEAILKLLTHPENITNYSMNALRSVEDISSRSVESTWEKILSMVGENDDNRA
jgi:glycosyltransferase involved in cell wall biosynthesis